MDTTPLVLALLILYLPAGYLLYRMKYPRGFIVDDGEPERERLLRTSRRRVLPLPQRRHDQ